MPRDFNSSGFSSSSDFSDHEDADPRVGLVNLADVMLVFACGLMLALVVKWNIDLPSVQELDESTMQEVDDVEEMQDLVDSASNAYMELGTVYQDPNTGKLYMMTQTDEGDDGYVPNEVPAPDDAAAGQGAASTGAGTSEEGA